MDMLTEEAMADLERRWKAAVAANFKCEHGERTGYCDLCTDATEHFESVARCYLPALLHEVREARRLRAVLGLLNWPSEDRLRRLDKGELEAAMDHLRGLVSGLIFSP